MSLAAVQSQAWRVLGKSCVQEDVQEVGMCLFTGRVMHCAFKEKKIFYFVYIVYKDNLPHTLFPCVTVSFIKQKYNRILFLLHPLATEVFFLYPSRVCHRFSPVMLNQRLNV